MKDLHLHSRLRSDLQLVQTYVSVSVTERARIFSDVLHELKKGRWAENGVVYEEVATSHTFKARVGAIDEIQFRLLRAVLELEAALEECP